MNIANKQASTNSISKEQCFFNVFLYNLIDYLKSFGLLVC